ncbi:BZ3500_MvSof-1268-A1-R1_Chr1-1g01241 [Microbotryum saponariae]|uniref:BZ3500_MvSof-1268-A1-R1_Chr1-1g01241 protein n=1 Tax=Microbotryum saponariae TaxID=289078 RepID=A0A2X0MCJ2_9BASI|nr:BZ3500_MvSof-1268-A1-R1_Chr1-1g01241 [Microbotryum saponariae]SCZ93761.1 BZ3501_MvSof-1269-A2-R1_Chr1-1g00837 [Microbotryum saponariae]
MSLEHEGSRSQMRQFRCNIAGCQRSFHHVRNLEAHLHVHDRPRPLDRVLPTSSAAERSHLQVLRQQRSRQEFFRRRRRRQKNLRNGWPDCDVDGSPRICSAVVRPCGIGTRPGFSECDGSMEWGVCGESRPGSTCFSSPWASFHHKSIT